jgi:hypothetical protein
MTVAVDFQWVLLDHPDLAAFDFHLFGLMMERLEGWWLGSNPEVDTGSQ